MVRIRTGYGPSIVRIEYEYNSVSESSSKSRFKAAICSLLAELFSLWNYFKAFYDQSYVPLVFIYFYTFEIQLSNRTRPILFFFSRHSKIFNCLASYINLIQNTVFGNLKSDKQKALKRTKCF